MHIKRTLALALTLCCLLTVLPVTPVQAVTHEDLTELVTKQYDAYAASIAQSKAADEAMEQLLNHALYGRQKQLDLGPSDALTACAFGSVMFREAVIQAVAYGLEALHNNKEDQVLMAFSPNWYATKSVYRVVELTYNTTPDYEDDTTRNIFISSRTPTGSLNRNDEALILVVGGARGRLWLDRDPVDPTLYHARITFFDRFDFNKSLGSAMKDFNGSLASILNVLGPLLGFKSFDWYSTANFDLRLPELCSHESGAFRWENTDGTLAPVSGEGLTENPLQFHETSSGTNYYELKDPVYLRHQDPWVMEFRYKGNKVFHIHAQAASYISHPYFLLRPNYFVAGQALSNKTEDDVTSGKTRHHYGIQTGINDAKEWHTYRIENRPSDGGANMLWLFIDGQEIGPLDNYYIQEEDGRVVDQGTKSDWVSGIDFTVRYIGNSSYPIRGELDYFAIWQNAQPLTSESTGATCTQAGTRKEICNLCGITVLTEEIPALGHDLQTVPGKAPTCEETGLTDSTLCARCGETVTAAQTLPALDHKPVAVPGTDPTCEENGLTEGSVCSVCNKNLTAQQPVPAPGHSYETGLCTRCGTLDPSLRPGDADFDGILTYNDALLVLRMSIGLDPIQPVHLLLCDTDSDETLTYNDALTILRRSIGLDG